MSGSLPEFLKLFISRHFPTVQARKRDRFRRYLFEALEPRNLLATFAVTALTDVVNPADDATIFTLREALNAANASSADDTIQFAAALTAGVVPVNIQMTGATFQLNAASGSGITTIHGPGADLLSIIGNGSNNGRVFFANIGANVVLRGLTIKNGKALDTTLAMSGGALGNDGTMTIENCTFQNNTAGFDGGAIHNRGTLQIFGSTFTANTSSRDGGAIATTDFGTSSIVNSTLSGNSAVQFGGAIVSRSSNTQSIIHSTIVLNTARSSNGTTGDGGGLSGDGTMSLYNTIVAGNKRGSTGPGDDDITAAAIITSASTGNLVGNAGTIGGMPTGQGNILGNNGSGVLPLASILDTTLRYNGGQTLTHALATTSPAVDKGFFNYASIGAGIDQRGQFRPRDYPGIANVGDGRDIGAFELRPPVNVLNLTGLRTDGVVVNGQGAGDSSGSSVSNAGDINGDGYDDFVVGARRADSSAITPPNNNNAGKSYVIFGKPDWSTSPTLTLSDTLGSNGFTIFGQMFNDESGHSVSSAGDVNGDGFNDLILGVPNADPAAGSDAGKSYVIFGKSDWSDTPTITLSDNLGSNGFTILGQAGSDFSGNSVGSAGDVNGDGFDDVIIGAPSADPVGSSYSGKSYVIFGSASFPKTVALSDNIGMMNPGVGGFTIFGQSPGDFSGQRVGAAGDVNGDGFDDLIVGAKEADPGSPVRNNAGKSYVILGASSLPLTILLSDNLGVSAPDVAGFTIFGQNENDRSGSSVSRAGDVNGDGYGDFIVGAYRAASSDGKSYVIFGKSNLNATRTITLSDDLGADGFTILCEGQDTFAWSGTSVAGAGDVNADGFDDLIIGAPGGAPSVGRERAGKTYIVFGKNSWVATPTITLSDNIGTTNSGVSGLTIMGQTSQDESGRSVTDAGDINGDGFYDLIIGAPNADPSTLPANNDAGKSYVIFGGNGFTNSISSANLGSRIGDTIEGTSGAEILGGGDGNDNIVSGGGDDVMLGGRGNDILAVSDLTFKRIVGGNGLGINNNNDTLRLDGSGLSLNLTTIPDNRILGIETIDITGSGDNTLTVNYREVLNISDETNTLIVRRNAGDTVNIGPGWTQQANEIIGGTWFEVFAQGQARLKIQSATTTAAIVNRQLFYNRSTSSIFGDGTGNPVNSIAPDKQALLPGQTAGFSHVTNYVRGLNGMVVDIVNSGGSINASDFQFAVSSNPDLNPFTVISAVPDVTVLPGDGVGGSTRVKIEFADAAIRNTWLRVTVLANVNTGLSSNDIFYFGNAVGEMNVGNLSGPPVVLRTNATDTANVRQNQSPTQNSVGIGSVHDLNKDGRVNASDTANVRQNQTPTGSITFFTAPTPLQLADESSIIDSAFADTSWLEAFQPHSRLSLRARSV